MDKWPQREVRTIADQSQYVGFTHMMELVRSASHHFLHLIFFLQKLDASTVHLIDYLDQIVNAVRSGIKGRASMGRVLLYFDFFLAFLVGELDLFFDKFAKGEDKLEGEVLEIRIGDILS